MPVQLVEVALRRSGGVVARAAELLTETLNKKVSHTVVHNYIRRYPVLQGVLVKSRRAVTDVAIDSVVQGVLEGDKSHVHFWLRRQPGWEERIAAGTAAEQNKAELRAALTALSDDDLESLHELAKKSKS